MSSISSLKSSPASGFPSVTPSTPMASVDRLGWAEKARRLALRAEPYAYTTLRIVAALLFAFHGAQKILGWHSSFMPPVW